jgi:hypothetical protein
MAKLSAPVHVSTTTRCVGDRVYRCHLLRQSYRDGKAVKHRTLANISCLPDEAVEFLRRHLRGEAVGPLGGAFTILRSLPHGHVAAVLGMLRELGLEKLIGSRSSRERDLVVAMIVARVLDPRPKLAMARALDPATAATSLGTTLELGAVDEDDLYEAMDWLLARQARIEDSLAARHLGDGSLVLYDLTSTWFEGRTCPLARRGYSRDGKGSKLQIEFGLLCDRDGRPVAVEVFEGDVADSMTVASQVRKVRERFGFKRVVVVGDRGMLTEARINEDVSPAGLDWITTLRAPAIRGLVAEGSLQPSLFDERDLGEITSEAYPGERLIVCRNPLVAEDRRRTREELLAATERSLDKVVAATKRERSPLRGQAEIALRVGAVVNRSRMRKHLALEITDESFSYRRDESRIAEEASLDGIYVLRTTVPTEELDAGNVVVAYKRLSGVERAFRSLKTVDLMVRPIHHRLADRVRAHVFLCMLSYYVEWHLRRAWAPLLFDDEAPDRAREGGSVVAPAARSESAERKAQTKRTEDGLPVHSFQTLLADLGTLTLNRCVQPMVSEEHELTILATPTAVQQRAFDLLPIPIRM